MRHRRAPAPALVVAAVLLLSGCGNDDDAEDAATATDPTSSTTAAPSTEPTSTDAAKEARAKAAVFQATDFPPLFRVHDPGEGVDIDVIWRNVIRCLGIEQTGQPLGLATSPTYVRALATQAQSTVEYMPQPAAQAIATALAGPNLNNCASQALSADAAREHEGADTGEVEVSAYDFPQLGGTTSATRVIVTLNLPERRVPIFQDLIVVFKGESVIRVVFVNPLEPFPEDLQRSLVEKVVSRA